MYIYFTIKGTQCCFDSFFFSIWFWCLPQCECSLQFWHTENLSAFISIGLVTFVPEIAFSVLFFYLFAMQMIKWERNVSLDQYCEEKFAEIKMLRKKEQETEMDRKRKNHCIRISASLDTIRHRLSFNRNSQDDVFELFTLYKFNARANLCKNLYINYQVP